MFKSTIKNRIIYTSLAGVGLILVLTGVLANWFLVGWLHTNFDSNLLTKAQVLVTLFEENEEGLELNFADEFMPEFDREVDAEYFQFSYASGEVFERSNSLGENDISFIYSATDDYIYWDGSLRDGRNGRFIQLNFVPQLVESLRTETRTTSEVDMLLVVARERESLDQMLFAVNLTILLAIPAILLSIFIAIRFGVGSGLQPLEELKSQIHKLDVNYLAQRIEIGTPVFDMASVVAALNQALDRIDQSFRREQRFTADAAHELRTPIAELMNMAEVAGRWPDKVQHRAFYTDVLNSSKKMQLIVNSLLDLARCKNGQMKLQLEAINVSDLVHRQWELYATQAEAKNINFEFFGDDSLDVDSSATELGSIVSNLLSNAAEYALDDSTIRANLTSDGKFASCSFSNQCHDLEGSDIDLIFDSLWRKDESRGSDSHIGMGLAIAKEYANVLGIELTASIDDETFTISISGMIVSG